MTDFFRRHLTGARLLVAALLLTTAVYWPGLSGSWLFDDYPNIVDNHGVQPQEVSVAALLNAALSSPASDFKRPLASLSFAANFLGAGMDPFGFKLTNLLIHLLNGALVFWVGRALLQVAAPRGATFLRIPNPKSQIPASGIVAALIAAAWLVLPINLTGVLYVVQRMESLANAFVLLGLLGYVAGRRRMLAGRAGLWLCVVSLVGCTGIGVLAKETAVMLPLYAALVEAVLFGFARPANGPARGRDWRLMALFALILVLPGIAGLAWLLPGILKPATWAMRDFTLQTRLLSEARIVVDYIGWTLLPTPGALSFYHDDFAISASWLTPWTTLASVAVLAAMVVLALRVRRRYPLVTLGIGLFLGCHLLTGTILPLELIYEHRNYFASFGLLLALVPLLSDRATFAFAASSAPQGPPSGASQGSPDAGLLLHAEGTEENVPARPRKQGGGQKPGARFSMAGPFVLAALFSWWTIDTAVTAYEWGDDLRLAQTLAARAPNSPRAQYELGRAYIIYSKNDPHSPYTHLAYAPLERAATLPDASILPEQALIFMNAHMHLPLKSAWWTSLIGKLKARPAGVQDESSLQVLATCARTGACDLPKDNMRAAFNAALSHPQTSPRVMATYSDYAWNVLNKHALALALIKRAVAASPQEPAYRITLVRFLSANGDTAQAQQALDALETLNLGGRLDGSIDELRQLQGLR